MATYHEIIAYVRREYGFVSKTCWITHVKSDYATARTASNRTDPSSRAELCPPDKRLALRALRHFGVILQGDQIRTLPPGLPSLQRTRPRPRPAPARRAGLGWRALAQAAFTVGYRGAIGDAPSWPADAAEADRLVRLFTIQKVFYEVAYEVANRPAWLRIPLSGILSFFGNDRRQEQ